jgi:tetratricopeptide (TPR) repeat protein
MLSFVQKLLVAASLALSASGPAAAQEEAPAVAAPTPAEALDALFADLAAAPNERMGAAIAARIEQRWLDSGSATVDLFMLWASTAMTAGNYGAALDFLDRAVLIDPDYAEAYNRRATAYFLSGNTVASIADVRRTLALEPRHYGALSGLGLMLESMGETQQAFAAYQRALALHPTMGRVTERLEELRPEVEGRPI